MKRKVLQLELHIPYDADADAVERIVNHIECEINSNNVDAGDDATVKVVSSDYKGPL